MGSPAQAVKEMSKLWPPLTHLQQYWEKGIDNGASMLVSIVCPRVQGNPDSYRNLSHVRKGMASTLLNEPGLLIET